MMKTKQLHPSATIPTRATTGSACYDITAIEGVSIEPHSSVAVRTGLAFEVPEGWAMLLFSRSGMGFKHGVRLGNCVGVIDSDYRQEVMVSLRNDSDEPYTVEPGDRIAQFLLVQTDYPTPTFGDVTPTDRGGFGSTGRGKKTGGKPGVFMFGETKYVTIRGLCELTGASRATVYRLKSKFPPSVSLPGHRVAWPYDDAVKWVNDLIA